MANLKTKFIGLELQSPIIVASCGLTSDLKKLQKLAQTDVGAIILKSVFEEQIRLEAAQNITDNSYPEEADYVLNYVRAHAIQHYIDLIRQAKETIHIPIIASINCIAAGEWTMFAKELEKAGADAIELNVFVLPTDEFQESEEIEESYFEIVKQVKAVVSIPIIVKIGSSFTNLTAFVSKLKAYGADAITIFNRFYQPDIDIETLSVGAANIFSTPADLSTTLRWTGILSGKDKQLEIAASTGVHSGDAVVKALLAGATTVQVCSALYEQGIGLIGYMNQFVKNWMNKKGYESIDEFRGKLSYADPDHALRYERAQFMKYFSDRKI